METHDYTVFLVRTGESEYNRQHDKDRSGNYLYHHIL